MSQFTEYKVISHHKPPTFHQLVQDALTQHWNLVGGVSVVVVPLNEKEQVYQTMYFQAVTK